MHLVANGPEHQHLSSTTRYPASFLSPFAPPCHAEKLEGCRILRQALVIPIAVNLFLAPALVHHKRGTLWPRAKLSLILSREASSPAFLVSVRGIPLSRSAWPCGARSHEIRSSQKSFATSKPCFLFSREASLSQPSWIYPLLIPFSF